MNRLKIIDEIVFENTNEFGYSKLDKPIDFDVNILNDLKNVTDPELPGITFEYSFFIDFGVDFVKTNLKRRQVGKSFVNPDTNPRTAYNVESDVFDVQIQTLNYNDYGKDLDVNGKCYIGQTQPKIPSRNGARGSFGFNHECKNLETYKISEDNHNESYNVQYCYPDQSKVSMDYFTNQEIMSHYDTHCRYGKTCGQYRNKGGICANSGRYDDCNIRGGANRDHLNSYGKERTGGYDKYESCTFEGRAHKINWRVPTHGHFRFNTLSYDAGCKKNGTCQTACREGLSSEDKKKNAHEFASHSFPCIKLKNEVVNIPNSPEESVKQLVYNTSSLPLYGFHYIQYYLNDNKQGELYEKYQKMRQYNTFTYEVRYRINFQTKSFNSTKCLEDVSNCDEMFIAHAVKSDGTINKKPLKHMDIYHLLKTVSRYKPSNAFLDTYTRKTIKSHNYDMAFRLMNDYCYFMKKSITEQQSFANQTEITNANNYCSLLFEGPIPNILVNAINYEGEQVSLDDQYQNIKESESYANTEDFENYENTGEYDDTPLQSFPEGKFIFLNYCRGKNFNSPECQSFYKNMYRKTDVQNGKMDTDVTDLIRSVCKNKDQYVPDDNFYFSETPGDYSGNDIEGFQDKSFSECKRICSQDDNCVGFIGKIKVIEFFSDTTFTNRLGELGEGIYNVYDMEAEGIPNDSVVSIRVPEGFICICYSDGFLTGDKIGVTGDVVLADKNFNNKLSSVHITPFDCEAYKQRYPNIARAYSFACPYLINHFLMTGLEQGLDASSFQEGRGCWLKSKLEEKTKNNGRRIFKKEDIDNVCSCYYNKEYYKKYLEEQNFPEEAKRELNSPQCWFPKCFLGVDSIKSDPNTLCSDLVICNNEIQTILKAGGDIRNVNINNNQISQCKGIDGSSEETITSSNEEGSNDSEEVSDDSEEETTTVNTEYIFLIKLVLLIFFSIIFLISISNIIYLLVKK